MFVGEENDWNGMEEESGLKRETLELWRRGGEKGREEMVVDIAATPTPDWKRCNPEIDEKGSFHYASQPTINHNYSTLSPSYHWIGLDWSQKQSTQSPPKCQVGSINQCLNREFTSPSSPFFSIFLTLNPL